MLALGPAIATVLSSVPGVGIELLRGELDVHRLYLIRAQRKQKAVEWRTTRSAQGVVRQVSHHSTLSLPNWIDPSSRYARDSDCDPFRSWLQLS